MKKHIHWKIIGILLLIVITVFTLTVLNIIPFKVLLPIFVCTVVIFIINMVWGITSGIIYDKNKFCLFCFGLISFVCIVGLIYYGAIIAVVINYF